MADDPYSDATRPTESNDTDGRTAHVPPADSVAISCSATKAGSSSNATVTISPIAVPATVSSTTPGTLFSLPGPSETGAGDSTCLALPDTDNRLPQLDNCLSDADKDRPVSECSDVTFVSAFDESLTSTPFHQSTSVPYEPLNDEPTEGEVVSPELEMPPTLSSGGVLPAHAQLHTGVHEALTRGVHVPSTSATRPVALSMSGCGFLSSYHFGSALCFQRNAPRLLARTTRFAGASAGSLVAAILCICPQKLQSSLDTLYTIADEVNAQRFGALTPGYSLIKRLATIVDDALPRHPDVCQLANQRLYVSITANNKNRLVSDYGDRDALIKVLMASCYIPIYAGVGEKPITIDDEECLDGGLTDNLPRFPDLATITISPFSGEADISPKDAAVLFDWTMKMSNHLVQVNLRNILRGAQALFPPPRSVLETYHDLGYKHTMKFLIKHGYYERLEGTPV